MSAETDVLVVDDEAVVRDGMRRVLTAAGYSVATAADGIDALEHAAARACRLVICDLMLPDRDGFELLRALRAMRPRIAIVMMTGFATGENAARAIEAGATDILMKPFEESELLEVVRRLLPERGPRAGEKER